MCFLAKKNSLHRLLFLCLLSSLSACEKKDLNELLINNSPVFYLEGEIDNVPFRQVAGEGYYMHTWYEKVGNNYMCKGALKPNFAASDSSFFLEWGIGIPQQASTLPTGEYQFRQPNGIIHKEVVDVSFTTLAIGKMPAQYVWEMGDGNTQSVPQPTHTYQPAAGQTSFLAKLTVYYQNGCISSHTRPIFMTPLSCASDFTTIRFLSNPLRLRFTGIGSQTQPPIAYKWYFGNLDSLTTVGNEVDYTFPTEGTYPVRLHIINANGCIAQIERNVIAGNNPELCATNFSYVATRRVAFDTIREQIENSSEIVWQDGKGNRFSTYHLNATGALKIEEISNYQPNLQGLRTQRLKVRLDTYLYDPNGHRKKVALYGYIGVALPQ